MANNTLVGNNSIFCSFNNICRSIFHDTVENLLSVPIDIAGNAVEVAGDVVGSVAEVAGEIVVEIINNN